EFITNMLEFIRVLILRKLGVEIRDISQEELPFFDELGEIFPQNKLLYMMSYLIACKADLKSSSNPYLILEALMIKLCKMDEMEEISSLINKLSFAVASPIPQTKPANPTKSAY